MGIWVLGHKFYGFRVHGGLKNGFGFLDVTCLALGSRAWLRGSHVSGLQLWIGDLGFHLVVGHLSSGFWGFPDWGPLCGHPNSGLSCRVETAGSRVFEALEACLAKVLGLIQIVSGFDWGLCAVYGLAF